MLGCFSTISHPSLFRRLIGGQREPSRLNSNRRSSPTSSTQGIHTLNVDVLLNIFDLYRLAKPDEYHDGKLMVVAWVRQCWWHKLVHVCRQWRNIILQSPSLLDLHLLCTHGVPVAKMLAHSPPLPLIIAYDHTDQSPEIDESGILLALSHRDRVRRVFLRKLPNLGKFTTVMDGQFPILERMYIDSRTALDLPVTFQAPNLRHLGLWGAYLPIGSHLLTTTTRLTYLNLSNASAYFPPSYLLAGLSAMLQLEILTIRFESFPLTPDFRRQPPHTPSITQVTLPNLRRFVFQGAATYLDGLVDRISAPTLNSLSVCLHSKIPVTIPHLSHFLHSSENLRFSAVKVTFKVKSVHIDATTLRFPYSELHIVCLCSYPDRQVASVVHTFRALSLVLSVVKKVTLTDSVINRSLAWRHDRRRQWRELLRPFTNVKAIKVQRNLVDTIFHSLLPAEGEPPLELLPNLEEVRCPGKLDAPSREAITAFIDARRVAGHLVSTAETDLIEVGQNASAS